MGRLLILVGMLCLSLGINVSAQADNGSIKGFITDASSGRLPDVVITAIGPALMGERIAVSDERGFYRLLDLPPGEYHVAAQAAGFARFEQRGVIVHAGLGIQLDFAMKIGDLTDTVDVRGEGPLLESEKAEQTLHIDGDFLRAVPLGAGHDWWDALRLAPGVLLKYGGGRTVETHGAGTWSNIFLLDGIDTGEPFWNQPGVTQLPPDSVAEISLTTSGHDASSRMGMGVQLGIVTRSGSNQTHGAATIDFQSRRFNATNVAGGTSADRTITRPGWSLGGALVHDRLWYFGSYRYVREREGVARSEDDLAALQLFQPGFIPFDSQLRSHQSLMKGTYQPTAADQLVLSVQLDRLVRENGAFAARFTQERDATTRSGGPLYSATWRRLIGGRLSLDAQAGFYSKPYQDRPQGDGPSLRIYSNVVSSSGYLFGSGMPIVEMGNSQSTGRLRQQRGNVNASLRYFPGEWHGSHEFTLGLNLLPKNEYSFLWMSPNDGFVLEDRLVLDPTNPIATRPFHRRYVSPVRFSGGGKSSRTASFFAQDTWRPHRRVVVNAGLHVDRTATFDAWGEGVQSSWQSGPRLGATYRLTSDGRTIVRGAFSRLNDAVANVHTFSMASPQQAMRDEYDMDGDGLFERVLMNPAVLERPMPVPGSSPGHVSSRLKQPRTDEMTLGVSRQLPFMITVDAMFLHRIYTDRVVAFDTNGIYENGRFLGYRDPTFNQIFEVRNSTDNWAVYRALELSLHKGFSRNLQFLFGYSHAREWLDGTWDQNDPASFLQPAAFPNKKGIGSLVGFAQGQINSLDRFQFQTGLGLLNSGVPRHVLKVNVAYVAPFGVTAAVSHVFQMGQYSGPILTLIPQSSVSHASPITLSNGRLVSNPLATRVRFFYPTRDEGQLQLPSLNVVNLRMGKRFKRGSHTFEGAVEVFNLFNQGNNLAFNLPTLTEGEPATFPLSDTQPPRAGQITMRWEF